MCKDCGCGLPGEQGVGISAHHEHDHEHAHSHEHTHEHDHDHDHPHNHDHDHEHDHSHSHEPETQTRRIVEVRQAILGRNERFAERNRGFFHGRGLAVLNVLSSPG